MGQQEVVVGAHFSCFLAEDGGSSSEGFTASTATPPKGPASRMRRGAESEPFLWHLMVVGRAPKLGVSLEPQSCSPLQCHLSHCGALPKSADGIWGPWVGREGILALGSMC